MCKGFAGIVGFKEGFFVGDATRNVFGKSRCCKEEMAVCFAVFASVLLGGNNGGGYTWSLVSTGGGWVDGCGNVGCSKSLLFLYAKKNDPFGGKKDNNHNPRHERKHLKPFLSSLKIKFSRTNRKRIVHHW